MDPETGRFASRDPFGGLGREPRTYNRFSFVWGDPVNRRDPSGAVPIGLVAVGVLVAMAVLSDDARAGTTAPSGSLRRKGTHAQPAWIDVVIVLGSGEAGHSEQSVARDIENLRSIWGNRYDPTPRIDVNVRRTTVARGAEFDHLRRARWTSLYPATYPPAWQDAPAVVDFEEAFGIASRPTLFFVDQTWTPGFGDVCGFANHVGGSYSFIATSVLGCNFGANLAAHELGHNFNLPDLGVYADEKLMQWGLGIHVPHEDRMTAVRHIKAQGWDSP